MRRRDYLVGTASLATLSLTGCTGAGQGDDAGGDGGNGPGGYGDVGTTTTVADTTTTTTADETTTATVDTTTTTTATTSPAAQDTYPDYEWSMLADASPTATTTVTLRGSAFHPLIATVSAGTAVEFVNEDSYGHTVTVPALDVHRELGGGERKRVTFEDAGSYGYVCAFHPPSMLGRVVVE